MNYWGAKLLAHSQSLEMYKHFQSSSNTLPGMWLLIHDNKRDHQYCGLFQRDVKVITVVDFSAMDLSMGLNPAAEFNQESYVDTLHPDDMIMRQLSSSALAMTESCCLLHGIYLPTK